MRRSWTVMSWNIRGSAGPDIAAVAAVVGEHAPDVLCLQEVRRRQAAQLAGRLGWQHTWHAKHHPYSPFAFWTTEGMAILSPHTITEAGATSLTPGVSTWTYRHRIVVSALVARHDTSAYRIVDLHLASDDTAAEERIAQAEAVVRMAATSGSPPVVMAGDLNQRDDEIQRVLCGAPPVRQDAWTSAAERGEADGCTNPAERPVQRLDHVLVPAEATVLRVHVPAGGERWAALSDHVPVVATFEMEWVEGDIPLP